MIIKEYRRPTSTVERISAIVLCAVLAGCDGTDVSSTGTPVAGGGGGTGGNALPVIMGTPATTAQENGSYAFTPAASDADLDILTFSIANRPTWATFDATTGSLMGTPRAADVGATSSIVISVTDGIDSAQLPAFSITVSAAGGGSQLEISSTQPDTYQWGMLSVGELTYVDRDYTFSSVPAEFEGTDYLRTANDDKFVSGTDAITFSVNVPVTVYVAYDVSISVLPSWLQSWTSNGAQIQTTDTTLDVYEQDFSAGTVSLGGNEMGNSMYVVLVTQQNGQGGNTNSAPTISGTPALNVEAGSAYFFMPAANDADGDTLTYTIINSPSWADFNNTNGALTGIPADMDVGNYGGVIISVSDGMATAALPSFDIMVNAAGSAPPPPPPPPPPGTGSAMLSWTPPTTNEDGSQLNDLAGYRIYYGTTLETDCKNYPSMLQVNGSGVASAMITDLAAGTWHFSGTAVDTSGNESACSNNASKTIQ